MRWTKKMFFWKILKFPLREKFKIVRGKFLSASHRWQFWSENAFHHLTCAAAISSFFTMPLFFIDPAFYGIEEISVFLFRNLCEILGNFLPTEFWLMFALAALTLIGRRFKTRAKQKNSISRKFPEGMKIWRSKKGKNFHEWWKIGGKVHRSLFPFYASSLCRPLCRVM